MRQPDVSAYDGSSPNGDTSQHRGLGIDGELIVICLLAGIVGMASGARVDGHRLDGGVRLEDVSARASNGSGTVFGVDSLFHLKLSP